MASKSSTSSVVVAKTSASSEVKGQGQKIIRLATTSTGKAGGKKQYVLVDGGSGVDSTSESVVTPAAVPTASQVAASALQLLASATAAGAGSGEPAAKSARREILVRQPSYCKILDDLKGAEKTMAKAEPGTAEVSTSGEAESSAATGSVQTISINGQQYQIVTPSAIETSSASGTSSTAAATAAATAASVIQYAAASQNGQTVFIPGTVAAGGSSSPQVITVTGSSSGGAGGSSVEEQVRKREVRLMKNREAARECRNKKKEYIKCLENRVAVLENQNKQLIEELKSLKELYTGQKN